MELSEGDQLARDVEGALNKYLGSSAPGNKKLLRQLRLKIANASNPGQQRSLAIKACPNSAEGRALLQELLMDEAAQRRADTLKECPKLCVQVNDLSWDQYYPGQTSIKYPDVGGLRLANCEDTLLNKMRLFDLLQGERAQCCEFQNEQLITVLDNKSTATLDNQLNGYEHRPAIIIPSSGKDGEWLGSALRKPNDFWWVRCIGKMRIIFVVAQEEIDNYKEFVTKGLSVVGYAGFGMGCGRHVGVKLAKLLGRVCIMTDDRTKGFSWYEEADLTLAELEFMISGTDDDTLDFRAKPFIQGVSTKGYLNILTLINPRSTSEQPNFSKYFIASKEDLALALVCDVLRQFQPITNKDLGDTLWKLQVRFDSRNPTYQNVDAKYKGVKGAALLCVTASPHYCSVPLEGAPSCALDWKHLHGKKGFLNQWDAVKLQDSAMFLLLKKICKRTKKSIADECLSKEEKQGIEQAFREYVLRWFSD